MNNILKKGRVLCAALALFASVIMIAAPNTSRAIAQALPTTAPSTAPTTAPTVTMVPQTPPPPVPRATSTATSAPITVYDTQTAPPPVPVPTTAATTKPITIAAYATTAPNGQPTIVPGTPPPTSPLIAGCHIFPLGDPVFNGNYYGQPYDVNDAAYLQSYLAVAGANATLSYSGNTNDWSVNVAATTTPRYPLVQTGTTTPLDGITTFPFLSTYEWQGKHQTFTGDRHIMVLDPANCHYYEAYTSYYPTPPSWQVVGANVAQPGYHAGYWDFSQPYPSAANPHKGGVNAGNVPQIAGMVTPQDIASGCICHALNIDVLAHALRYNHSVFPSHGQEMLTYSGPSADASLALPMGAHLILDSNFTLSCSTACPITQMVVKSAQTYGVYVMDTGSYSGIIYFANQQNADGTWSFPYPTSDISNLGQIPFSKFHVLPPPGCTSVEGCIQ